MDYDKLVKVGSEMTNKTMHCVRSKTGKPSLWTLLKYKKENENFNRITEIVNKDLHLSDSIIFKDERKSKLLKTIDLENNKYILKIFLDEDGYKVSFFEITDISAYENKITLEPIFRIEFNNEVVKYNNLKENLTSHQVEIFINKLKNDIDNLIEIFKNK